MNNSGLPGNEDLLGLLKQRMEALEEENRILRASLAQVRQELADLRRGVGITVMVDGKAVLSGSPSSVSPDTDMVSFSPTSSPPSSPDWYHGGGSPQSPSPNPFQEPWLPNSMGTKPSFPATNDVPVSSRTANTPSRAIDDLLLY
jgi:hypothetical protein